MTIRLSKRHGAFARQVCVCGIAQIALCMPIQVLAQPVIFVDDDATGANDGSSWCDACLYLQDALAAAAESNESITEIRVAQGLYKPDQGEGQVPGDRYASFALQNGLALVGGFAGCGALDPDARDPTAFESILSGDLDDNDDPTWTPESNCCVATGEPGCDDEVCVQAITWFRSKCDERWDTACADYAHRWCCDLCRATFCDNSYHVVTVSSTDPTSVLDGFVITAGEANGYPDEENVDFSYGGGLYGDHGSPTVSNCVFTGDTALKGGGVYITYGNPSITDCTFSKNLAVSTGGGVYTLFSDPVVTSCVFVENAGCGMHIFRGDEPAVTGCVFRENQRAGLRYDASGLITECEFIGNVGDVGGGLYLTGSAPNIIDCDFIGNHGNFAGGMYSGAFPQVANSRFIGNSATSSGGGLFSSEGLILVNCVFSGNSANFAGGLCHGLGPALLLGCTFVGNFAGGVGGVWFGGLGDMTIANSIFWNNQSDCCVYHGVAYGEYPPEVNYSCMQGGAPAWGVGNVSYEPLFVDANGLDNILGTEDDNFRLSVDSPLIDAGDPDPPLVPYMDHDGHERILCGRLDMGAYEFGIGDYDCNMFVELMDFAAWDACMTGPDGGPFDAGCEAFDFDADAIGDIDLRDFAGFQLTIPGE